MNVMTGLFPERRFRGAGGSRTLVQTRKPYAFYMLISAFGFRAQARPEPPTCALAFKISSQPQGQASTISDMTAPLNRNASEQQLPSDVSFPHLVQK